MIVPFVILVTAAVAFGLSESGGGPSASLHRWQSGDLVGVRGENAGKCATAYPPWSNLIGADQWIICGQDGSYRCYQQRMHAVDFKAQAMRPSAFDVRCRSALAVLRKARILR